MLGTKREQGDQKGQKTPSKRVAIIRRRRARNPAERPETKFLTTKLCIKERNDRTGKKVSYVLGRRGVRRESKLQTKYSIIVVKNDSYEKQRNGRGWGKE